MPICLASGDSGNRAGPPKLLTTDHELFTHRRIHIARRAWTSLGMKNGG
jgi:hypothetical protein